MWDDYLTLTLSNSERGPCQGHNLGSGCAGTWELETESAQTHTLNQSQVHVNTVFEEIN